MSAITWVDPRHPGLAWVLERSGEPKIVHPCPGAAYAECRDPECPNFWSTHNAAPHRHFHRVED